jgi:hypothetical protein
MYIMLLFMENQSDLKPLHRLSSHVVPCLLNEPSLEHSPLPLRRAVTQWVHVPCLLATLNPLALPDIHLDYCSVCSTFSCTRLHVFWFNSIKLPNLFDWDTKVQWLFFTATTRCRDTLLFLFMQSPNCTVDDGKNFWNNA